MPQPSKPHPRLFRVLSALVLPFLIGSALLVLPILSAPGVVHAESDTFALGNGHDSALVVSTANRVVNSYAQVTAPLAPGDTSIAVASLSGFSAGDLVMVLQTTGVVPTPASGASGPIDLSSDPVGRWELARLATAGGTALALTAPLAKSYAANVSQIIRVPEYTTVTVNAGASISAAAWNGSTGGVLAFLAQGTITNNGAIRVTGLGFRGGSYVDDTSGDSGCSGLDLAAVDGAQKGEGIANTRYGPSQTGAGNAANGGGGGVCYKSGGGGGGNGGAGGHGGYSDGSFDGARNVGGLGGAALSYALLDHLTLGGGGGAGHGSDGSGVAGGSGGGAIFIRGNQLAGTGLISTNGDTGKVAGSDGGSGGGAGGSIYLRITSAVACSSINANGGIGGSVNTTQVGPGGGGAGGRLLLQWASGGCATSVLGAQAGTQQDPGATGGSTYGAQAGANGIVATLSGGLTQPAAPTIATPANSTLTNNRRPVAGGTAQPNSTMTIMLNGTSIGQATADNSGSWSFTPGADLNAGSYQLQVFAEYQALQSTNSVSISFTVDLTPPAAPVVLAPTTGSLTGSNRPSIAGTAEANSTVTVYLDGVVAGTTSADATGNWSFTPASALADGSHAAKATTTDAAGNTGALSNINTFTIDTAAPSAPVVVSPATGSLIGSNRPSIAGTAEANSTVTVYLDGNSIGSTSADATGNWSFTPGSALSDGAHAAKAAAADAAGNTGALSNVNTFTIDTTPPAAPVVLVPATGSLIGNNRPSIAGTAEANSTVTVYLDGVVAGTTSANASGNWSFTPASALADGSHAAKAAAADAAGNTGALSNINTFTIDTTPPAAPVVLVPANGSLTGNNRPSIAGTAEANSTVTVYLDGNSIGTTSADATGNWSFTPGSALADGSYAAKVTATDPAGNTGALSNINTFTVDTAAPVSAATISLASGPTTYNATPTIGGTAEPNSTVTVYLDGSPIGTASADGSGQWQFTLPSPLAEGSHVIATGVADAAGNAGPPSSTIAISYVAPHAPALTSAAPAPASYGASYSHMFVATGTPAPTFSIVSGALPPGMALAGNVLAGTPTAAGSYGPITLKISNGYGSDITQTFSLVVNKAVLTAAPASRSRAAGRPNPSFAVSYSGFVRGDTAAALAGSPVCASSATSASPAGSYPIHCTIGTLAAANYTIAFVDGTLTITSAPATSRRLVYLPVVVR